MENLLFFSIDIDNDRYKKHKPRQTIRPELIANQKFFIQGKIENKLQKTLCRTSLKCVRASIFQL